MIHVYIGGMSYEQRPALADFPSFYHRYVEEAERADMLQALRIPEERMRGAIAGPGGMTGRVC